MKRTNHFKIASLSLVLFLAIGLYNCKPKETTPEIPDFTTGYKDVKLPDLTQSTPAAVTTTPGTITTSAAATAASSGLASGTVTAAVTSTAADMQKAVSPADAGKIATAFTPSVVTTMLSGGALPAELSTSMKAMASNAALASYLPKVTYPSVNGTVVSGLVKETDFSTKDAPVIALPDFITSGTAPDVFAGVNDSPCTKAAEDAFNAAKKPLDDGRAAQEKIVNDTYASRVLGISSTSCKAGATTALTTAATAAKAKLDQQLAGLNTLLTNKAISQETYNLLSFFVYFDLYNSVVAATAFYGATVKACDVASDTAKASAKAAQNTDLTKIQAAYGTAISTMQTTLNAAYKTCHDQGQG